MILLSTLVLCNTGVMQLPQQSFIFIALQFVVSRLKSRFEWAVEPYQHINILFRWRKVNIFLQILSVITLLFCVKTILIICGEIICSIPNLNYAGCICIFQIIC